MHPLSTLSQAPSSDVVALADDIVTQLARVDVIQCRTGIVMLPYRDTARGVTFHLGEVLMAEARVRAVTPSGSEAEGYGACLGRDTQHALAMAVLDAALRAGVACDRIEAYVAGAEAAQRADDAALLTKVEATRVAMETF